jgi:hypothetical protein
VAGLTGTLAATPLLEALAGSLTMTGRRRPRAAGVGGCSAGWLSTAHLLQPAVSMTKLLEIYYPNLTKNRIRLASGNEDERRSQRRFIPKLLGICYADRQDRPAARVAAASAAISDDRREERVASYALAIDQGRTSTRAMLFGPTLRSPPCGNGSSAAGLGRSAGCWPEGGRKAPAPLACRVAMAPTGNTARRCCARQKQPVQTSCSANLTTW